MPRNTPAPKFITTTPPHIIAETAWNLARHGANPAVWKMFTNYMQQSFPTAFFEKLSDSSCALRFHTLTDNCSVHFRENREPYVVEELDAADALPDTYAATLGIVEAVCWNIRNALVDNTAEEEVEGENDSQQAGDGQLA